MSQNTILYIVVGLILAILLGIGVYYLLRYLRGSIKITLNKKAYGGDEEIHGSFDLHAKKPIEGNFLVARLICTKKVEYTNQDNDSSNSSTQNSTRTYEVYRYENMIEQGSFYDAGFTKTYEFTLKTPDAQKSNALVDMLSTAMNFLSDKRITFKWHVEVVLDAEGIDLADTQKVYVNLSSIT